MKKINSRTRYSSLRAYISFIATFKGYFLIVFSLFAIADIILAVVPIFIGQFVAALSQHPLNRTYIYQLVGILLLISIGHDLIWRSGEWFYRKLLNNKTYEFENVIFQAVITKPYPYFIDKFTGKISSYVTGISREFRDFVDQVCYQYTDLLTKLPIIAVIMFTVNTITGLVFTTSMVVMFIAGKYLVGYTVAAERQLTDATSSLDGYVIDVISNFVSVKAFRRERAELDAVYRKRQGVVEASSKMLFWNIIFWGVMSAMVRWVVWPATILLNVSLFLHGDINLAQITTFTSTLLIFSDFIWVIIWNVSQFNIKLGRIEESYRYLFGTNNVVREYVMSRHEDDRTKAVVEFRKKLTLQNLSFAYPDRPEHPILKDISIDIEKNEKIGVVGTSGSGKTTLIKLLLGYYALPRGMTLLDGQAVDNRELVSLIAYVPQDTPLFHRTIGENIAYGANQTSILDHEQIERAAKRAHAHEFIMQTTDGYDALVGERGIKLSMGQRQRIAIARAFLDEKPILVLDEATSALDSESEVLVQEALEDLWHDRTVIAIAHRLSTLRHMDRIIVMDQGAVIEQGTHQQLLKQKGRYYRLWQHQSGGILTETENG